MSDNNVQEDFEVTKQAMLAYEVKLKREIVMVTKEEVEKAKDNYQAAAEAAYGASEAAEVDEAVAEADAAWDEYLKLEREYEDGNKSTED